MRQEFFLHYKSMTEKCKQQWEEIKELEAKSRTAEEDEQLQTLKNTFTLVLSANYQMNQLIPTGEGVRSRHRHTIYKRYHMMYLVLWITEKVADMSTLLVRFTVQKIQIILYPTSFTT